MIDKPDLRCFHRAEFRSKGHDHQLSSSEVTLFHHAIQLVLMKPFEPPFDKESADIVVEELSTVVLFEELA